MSPITFLDWAEKIYKCNHMSMDQTVYVASNDKDSDEASMTQPYQQAMM